MSDLLAKLAALKNQVKGAEPTPPAPTVPAATTQVTPAPTSQTIGDLLRSKLAAAQQPVATTNQQALAAATKVAAGQAGLQQSLSLARADVVIPEGLLDLDEQLYEIDGFPVDEMKSNLQNLYISLTTNQADLPLFCKKIDQNLRQYPELSYLLKPEQVNLFVRGLMFLKGVNIVTKDKKVSAAANIKAAIKGGGLDFDFDIKM